MEQDITIEVDKKIEAIVRRNFDEKSEEYIDTIESCEDCRYYE